MLSLESSSCLSRTAGIDGASGAGARPVQLHSAAPCCSHLTSSAQDSPIQYDDLDSQRPDLTSRLPYRVSWWNPRRHILYAGLFWNHSRQRITVTHPAPVHPMADRSTFGNMGYS